MLLHEVSPQASVEGRSCFLARLRSTNVGFFCIAGERERDLQARTA